MATTVATSGCTLETPGLVKCYRQQFKNRCYRNTHSTPELGGQMSQQRKTVHHVKNSQAGEYVGEVGAIKVSVC